MAKTKTVKTTKTHATKSNAIKGTKTMSKLTKQQVKDLMQEKYTDIAYAKTEDEYNTIEMEARELVSYSIDTFKDKYLHESMKNEALEVAMRCTAGRTTLTKSNAIKGTQTMTTTPITKATLKAAATQNINPSNVVEAKDIAYAPLMNEAKRWAGKTEKPVVGKGWTIADSYEFISDARTFRAFNLQKVDKKGNLWKNAGGLVVMVATVNGATSFLGDFMGDASMFMEGANPNTLKPAMLIGLEVDIKGEMAKKANGDDYFKMELDTPTIEECW